MVRICQKINRNKQRVYNYVNHHVPVKRELHHRTHGRSAIENLVFHIPISARRPSDSEREFGLTCRIYRK
jgi:hypothetical protein